LLGLVLKLILEPFTNPAISLMDQIKNLSTFSHLSFTLFRSHRLGFMSNQLYGDSQSMVKNAIFCQQQQLDGTKPFYLFQVGDDLLEKLFGKLHMSGRHNSAMNYVQAIDRLGHAYNLQAVFLCNPDLDQGQRWISMLHADSIDHLNMKSWTGHAITNDCHLPSAW
ncbi:hypothetical protein B0H10DRAFT_1718556, partial [Mycena sp. CBHHK59/15]